MATQGNNPKIHDSHGTCHMKHHTPVEDWVTGCSNKEKVKYSYVYLARAI